MSKVHFVLMLFFLMIRRPPRSTRTDTLFPYTTLFRSFIFIAIQAMGQFVDPDSRSPVRRRPPVAAGGQRAAGGDFRPIGQRGPLELADREEAVEEILQPMADRRRSEEHTSELQSLMRISYAVFCLKKTQTRVKNVSQEHTQAD